MLTNRTIIVGLTGGIACGKSTISEYLTSKGIPVIDGDLVAREIVEPGSVGLAQIEQVFGSAYLQADGTLNRALLGHKVFSDPDALHALNAITKPLILEALQQKIATLQHHAMIVLDVALLLEDDDYRALADVVWVVNVTPEQQLLRLMKRNGYDETEAKNRIAAQMDDATRRQYADVVIDNNGTIAETLAQVERLLYNNSVLIENCMQENL